MCAGGLVVVVMQYGLVRVAAVFGGAVKFVDAEQVGPSGFGGFGGVEVWECLD